MSGEIINKVANSGLITIDLSDYAPSEKILEIDLSKFLFNKKILKEKLFRQKLKEFDFSIYKNSTIGITCNSDTIIPMWGFMLITSFLKKVDAKIYAGNKQDVYQNIFLQNISAIDPSKYKNKKVIIKGCSSIPLSESVYITITEKLHNHVNSLMFGEACSAVPIYKKKL